MTYATLADLRSAITSGSGWRSGIALNDQGDILTLLDAQGRTLYQESQRTLVMQLLWDFLDGATPTKEEGDTQ